MMKILGDVMKKKAATEKGGEDEEEDKDDLALDSIGCTANVVMIDYPQNKIYVANAGDSRCIMGKGGNIVPLSFDHKPENQVELDRI